MKVHNLKQNSPEWHEFRKERIGASDIPVLMGHSPYVTPIQLYLQKKGQRSKATTWAMAQGHKHEDRMAKTLFERKGIATVPVVATHSRHDWLMASFDGIDIDRTVLAEFKYNSQKNHEHATTHDKPCLAHWLQMQAQMMVAEIDRSYYVSFNEKLHDTYICEVYADVIEQKRIYREAKAFKKRLDDNKPPPSPVEDRQDETFVYLTTCYRNARLAYVAAEAALKTARERLLETVKNPCRGNGYEIVTTNRKGTVQCERIPQLNGVNLDQYRGPTTTQWHIRDKNAQSDDE